LLKLLVAAQRARRQAAPSFTGKFLRYSVIHHVLLRSQCLLYAQGMNNVTLVRAMVTCPHAVVQLA
jgi:hypothetical protein